MALYYIGLYFEKYLKQRVRKNIALQDSLQAIVALMGNLG
jgi:hypothetical protein